MIPSLLAQTRAGRVGALASRPCSSRTPAAPAPIAAGACARPQHPLAPSTSGRRPSAPLHAASPASPDPASSGPAEAGPGPAVAAEVVVDDAPWSPEFIRQLVQEQEEAETEAQAEAIIEGLGVREDPEGFYNYVDRAFEEGPREVDTPMNLLLEEMTGRATIAYPAPVATEIIGMGTWRLKDMVDPMIEFLVTRIEGSWREICDTDLCLYPREAWKDRGWDLVDSADPQRELEGYSYADIPDPERGEEGYPRLQLENRVYCSKAFRKLHVEVGVRQDGLQVLHVVLYPRYNYDLPIFGLDIVMVEGRCTLAVVDCCPLARDLRLPSYYMETMATLQHTFLEGSDPSARRIPDWGAATFSKLALVISPQSPEELAGFVKYALALHRAHLSIAANVTPVLPTHPGDSKGFARLEEMLEGQKRFCDNQLVNKKTSRVLEKAFGEEWTKAYMEELMFDFNPEYEPPYFDASYERLYQYFDENPEFGALADEADALEEEALADRAMETINAAGAGEPVSQDKLQLAMKFLMESDPTFRAAMQTLQAGAGAGAKREVTKEDVERAEKELEQRLGQAFGLPTERRA